MRVKRLWVLLTIIATLTVALAGLVNASPTELALDPREVKDIDPGGTFNVDVTVNDVSNLYGWQFVLHFDPDVVHVDNVTEGPFLGSTGKETYYAPPTINNDDGYVQAGATFMPPFPEEGVTGTGVLATILFSVTGRGSVNLEFDEDETLTFLREVRWIDSVGQKIPISHTLADGTFSNGGGAPILSLPLIIATVVVIALCGVGAFYFIRRRKT